MCRLHGTTFPIYVYTINSVHDSYSTKYPKHALCRSKNLAFNNSENFIYSHILIFKKFLILYIPICSQRFNLKKTNLAFFHY